MFEEGFLVFGFEFVVAPSVGKQLARLVAWSMAMSDPAKAMAPRALTG